MTTHRVRVVLPAHLRVLGRVDGEVAGIRERVAAGERLKDVTAEVAAARGLSRKALYDAVVSRPRGRPERT